MGVTSPSVRRDSSKKAWRNWWVRQLHSWHWISAAISLVVMLFFAVTGITLNHAASIPAAPSVVERQGDLPRRMVEMLVRPAAPDAPLPEPVAQAVRDAVGLDAARRPAEWSDEEIYVALPRPGGDAWVSIDRATGRLTAEITDRGWISYLNDLHKGRNSGIVWFWFIDLFAVACIVFTLTGLLLLQIHSKRRRSTWPLVSAGLALPALLALLFVH
nr:PepSY-associated TM helix domain-containing protein [Sphingobium jiangsuense]